VRQLPRATRAGYADTMLPLSALFDRSDLPSNGVEAKPAMIWFSSLTPDEKLEKRLFDSMEVAVAARYFNCVRIYVEDIDSKADRERYAKIMPAIVFLDTSGHEVTRITGNGTSSPIVFGGMQKATAADFKKSLADLVASYTAFLKKFDKVQGDVNELEAEILAGMDHVAKHDCANGRKKLKEDQDEMKPLQAKLEKLLDEEKSLLKPELKTAPKGKETASAAPSRE